MLCNPYSRRRQRVKRTIIVCNLYSRTSVDCGMLRVVAWVLGTSFLRFLRVVLFLGLVLASTSA
jgi:hypothetical protein